MKLHSMELHSKQILNIEILKLFLRNVLKPRSLNNPFASCFLINFDFLELNTPHFDNIVVIPLLVAETFGSILSVFFAL